MKIQLKNDTVIATAETKDEMVFLLTLDKPKKAPEVKSGDAPRKKRKYTRHKQVCDICKRGFQGKKGLGIHLSKVHGVLGTVAAKYRVRVTEFPPVKSDLLPSLPEIRQYAQR